MQWDLSHAMVNEGGQALPMENVRVSDRGEAMVEGLSTGVHEAEER